QRRPCPVTDFIQIAHEPKDNCPYSLTTIVLSGSAIALDDVLLLPADARAASTTYDPLKGKTSETSANGNTTYYEYDFANNLTQVRDHNGSITKQVEQSVAGLRGKLQPEFSIGSVVDGQAVSFDATSPCLADAAGIAWNFGDGTATTPFSQVFTATHTFPPVTGTEATYSVTLYVRTSDGRLLSTIRPVRIIHAPLPVTFCVAGVVSLDDCNVDPPIKFSSCGSPLPFDPTDLTTTFMVTITGQASCAAGYTYQWQAASNNGEWFNLSGKTTPTLLLNASTETAGTTAFRCVVRGCGQETISSTATITHYRSSSSCRVLYRKLR
ncbi:hypothetical protein IC235_21605, partial [Hymenobacter sp. BT664]